MSQTNVAATLLTVATGSLTIPGRGNLCVAVMQDNLPQLCPGIQTVGFVDDLVQSGRIVGESSQEQSVHSIAKRCEGVGPTAATIDYLQISHPGIG